ncbi:hypothetical protein AA313_de0200418 [Arthrobotrys entomopaga]|nr:hypothetical protein AA313_de0200418 [Arthrobotrys entomopaga]
MEVQAEEIKVLEEDMADERQRTDEEIRKLGINDNILRRDLRELKERTRSLERDSKDVLFAAAVNGTKTPPPVIINNNCLETPWSASGTRSERFVYGGAMVVTFDGTTVISNISIESAW